MKGAMERPQGRLRVDMLGGIAHALIVPNLHSFRQRYPDIYLLIGVNDRQVDLIQEGVDCVIRTGGLEDSALIARPLGSLPWITCAAPSYLAQHGTPVTLDDLSDHHYIHYFSGTSRRSSEMHFNEAGKKVAVEMKGVVAVNETELYIKLCLMGYGLMQLAEVLVSEHLQTGALIEVLSDQRPSSVPVSLLYPHHRFLSPALLAFSEWTADIFSVGSPR
jgi:LysR family transcriptional regulator for bpeEF and oprC